ncbi:hypothetical protein AAVH_39659, partial [Aphelenchoides avenae]
MDSSLMEILAAIKQEPADSELDAMPAQGGPQSALVQVPPPQQYGAAFPLPMMSPMPALQLNRQSDFVADVPSAGLYDNGYWTEDGWHELPALTPVLMGTNLAAMDGLRAYGQAIEIGAGHCYWLPLPVMPPYVSLPQSPQRVSPVPAYVGPTMLSPAASSGSPPTPPPSTSQYQETVMESSIRRMWRARSRLPYDRDVMVDAIMDVPFMAGRQRPSTLDGAVGALWKARGGSSPFPYDAVVGDFIASLEAAKTPPAAAVVIQMDCSATAVTPSTRQESPMRPLAGLDEDAQQASPMRPLSGLDDDARTTSPVRPGCGLQDDGRPASPLASRWATDYVIARERCRERQAAVGKAAA